MPRCAREPPHFPGGLCRPGAIDADDANIIWECHGTGACGVDLIALGARGLGSGALDSDGRAIGQTSCTNSAISSQ